MRVITKQVFTEAEAKDAKAPTFDIVDGRVFFDDKEIPIEASYEPDSYIHFFKTATGEYAGIDAKALTMSREGSAAARSLILAKETDKGPALSIWYEGDWERSSILVNRACLCKVDSTPTEESMPLFAFAKFHRGAQAFLERFKAKKRVLENITPMDSLSALEKQVDYLTKIVGELIQKVSPESVDVLEVIERFNHESSLYVKTIYDAIDESCNYKKRIREHQSSYISEV